MLRTLYEHNILVDSLENSDQVGISSFVKFHDVTRTNQNRHLDSAYA